MFLIPTVAITSDDAGNINRIRITIDIDKVSTYSEGTDKTTNIVMDNGMAFTIDYEFDALMKELAQAED